MLPTHPASEWVCCLCRTPNRLPKAYFRPSRNSFDREGGRPFELVRSVLDYRVGQEYQGAFDNKIEMVCLAFDLGDEAIRSSLR